MLGRFKKKPYFVKPADRYGIGTVLGANRAHAGAERSRHIKRNLVGLAMASTVAISGLQAKGEINVVPWQDEQGQLDWGQIDVIPFDDNTNVPEPGMPPSTEPTTERLEVNIGG